MSPEEPEATRIQLTQVDDVSGVDAKVRDEVARSTGLVESSTAGLRKALRELHQAEDEAWRRYAADLESATLRLDAQLGMASARLRAERATTTKEIKDALEEAARTWRSRADEIRVQTHLGEMDARDAGLHALDELEHAGHRITELAAALRTDASESVAAVRDRARAALDEIGRALHDLRPGRGSTGHAPE